MENNKKKCNFKEHKELDAITYCQECQIYLCNKFSTYHDGLFENHHLLKISDNINNIFTGYCSEYNHRNLLKYFCRNHNILCCAACIAKIKDKGDGKHKDCDVCIIDKIKDEKKNKLKENIKKLEDLSKGFEKSMNDIKMLFKKINDDKDELKESIQKIFTQLRNKLNEREDELLNNIEEEFTKVYQCDDKLIKEYEKLPNKIKESIEKGKLIDKEWNNDNEIISSINDCINLENNIKNILIINDNLKNQDKYQKIKIQFLPKESGINDFSHEIKNFGKITPHFLNFRRSPLDINNKIQYTLTTSENNSIIITKKERNEWVGILGENEFEKSTEYKWRIKILKNKSNHIRIGIIQKDYDIKSSGEYSCGYCFYLYYNSLYSGPPYYYSNKKTNLNSVKNEVIIVMTLEKERGKLKFIIDNIDKGYSYTDIPLEKPYVPVVFLYDLDDSIKVEYLES